MCCVSSSPPAFTFPSVMHYQQTCFQSACVVDLCCPALIPLPSLPMCALCAFPSATKASSDQSPSLHLRPSLSPSLALPLSLSPSLALSLSLSLSLSPSLWVWMFCTACRSEAPASLFCVMPLPFCFFFFFFFDVSFPDVSNYFLRGAGRRFLGPGELRASSPLADIKQERCQRALLCLSAGWFHSVSLSVSLCFLGDVPVCVLTLLCTVYDPLAPPPPRRFL